MMLKRGIFVLLVLFFIATITSCNFFIYYVAFSFKNVSDFEITDIYIETQPEEILQQKSLKSGKSCAFVGEWSKIATTNMEMGFKTPEGLNYGEKDANGFYTASMLVNDGDVVFINFSNDAWEWKVEPLQQE